MLPQVYAYYSRLDVQKALLEASSNREVVQVYPDGSFGKRPDMLSYPKDIVQAVKQNAIAFHASIERWEQPMRLVAGLSQQAMDELRKGFDIVLDLDVKHIELGKIATSCMIEALEDHGITHYGIKFTGGKSFHIAIPFEALPQTVDYEPTAKLYPELPRKVIEYLKWYVKERLTEAFLNFASPNELASLIGKKLDEITGKEGIDCFKILELDPMMYAPRHLIRLPYSLHERTMLVSLPLTKHEIKGFKPSDAAPSQVEVKEKFFKKPKLNEAESLIVEAIDWATKFLKPSIEPETRVKQKVRKRKFKEDQFPPCIKKILKGLSDGRKRSIFLLVAFLSSAGYEFEEIKKILTEWNMRNLPPLRENYLRNQLKWHERQERSLLPPSCDNPIFYKSIGICEPDEICKQVKNPAAYPFKLLAKLKGKFGLKEKP